jgi:hypothetical protein
MIVKTISLDQWSRGRREVGALESLRVVPKRYTWLSRAEILKNSSASFQDKVAHELPWKKSNAAAASISLPGDLFCEVKS